MDKMDQETSFFEHDIENLWLLRYLCEYMKLIVHLN